MSKVAKYRRQVSEDPDIDSLLSTLSPEEMEELEKELDVVPLALAGKPGKPRSSYQVCRLVKGLDWKHET